MTKFNISKANELLAKQAQNIVFNVQSVEKISSADHSIIAELNQDKLSIEKIAEQWAKLTNYKTRLVKETWKKIPYHDYHLARFISTATVSSKPYTSEYTQGMTVVTANTLCDNENSIWKVVGEGENKRLVLVSEEDFDDLYNQHRARMISANWEHQVPYQTGDYLAWYNPSTQNVGYGFGIRETGKYRVFDRQILATIEITPVQVLEAVTGCATELKDDMPTEIKQISFAVQANMTQSVADKLIEYYRKIYSSKPELMAKWEMLIKQASGKFIPHDTEPTLNKNLHTLMENPVRSPDSTYPLHKS